MESKKNFTWHKIAETLADINVSENGLAEIQVEERKICIAIYQNSLYACTNKCPHAGANMAESYIDGLGNIVCPLHKYKFTLKNGYNTSGEGYKLKTYPIQITPDGVYVSIPNVSFII
jgi:nitrite reductase/ring-hydroxylating ferredoxin subunit